MRARTHTYTPSHQGRRHTDSQEGSHSQRGANNTHSGRNTHVQKKNPLTHTHTDTHTPPDTIKVRSATWISNMNFLFRLDSWVGKIPWRRDRLPTPVFWPGEVHGLYPPWGRKESDRTERLSLRFTSPSNPHFSLTLAPILQYYLLDPPSSWRPG